MDSLVEQIAALEQQLREMANRAQETECRLQELDHGKRTAEGRVRHWRAGAAVLALLGLALIPLRSGLAQSPGTTDSFSSDEVQKLKGLAAHLLVEGADGHELTLTGANLHIVNGMGG